MKFLRNILLISSAILLILSCQQKNSPETIGIGLYASITGNVATLGQGVRQGIEMRLKEANAAGGIHGKKITLFVEDDRGNPEEAQSAAAKLISKHRVSAVLGAITSAGSLAGGPICQSNHVPMLTPGATNPKVTQIGDFIFRICWVDSYQGKLMAKFARNVLKAQRVGILYDVGTDYSSGLTEVFEDAIQELGAKVVAKESFSTGDNDFSAQLTVIRSKNPDVIFIPAYYTESGLIVLQARKLGIKSQLIGTDGWESPVMSEIAGNSLDGSYYCSHFFADDPDQRVREFDAKFRKDYGQPPSAPAALGYDAAGILVNALKIAGTDTFKIRDALAKTKNYPGVTGNITIDANRNALKPAVVLQFRGSKPQFVQKIF
jgi:branched-chain amino acid transport system substrate-binding protein